MAPQQEPAGDFDTSGVEVVDRAELGGRSAVAIRKFKAGERVFREQALVVAADPTNVARLRAYAALDVDRRREIREQFWAEAPDVRCAATAACGSDASATGDSAAEVLTVLRGEGHSDLELAEVETVIRVWNLNAYDSALAPVACKVAHSCAPNVAVRVDVEAGAIEATACRPIAEGETLGSWYFQDTGLWWMGTDVRRAVFRADRGFVCQCARCLAPDACRAVPCEACEKASAVPQGAARSDAATRGSLQWTCNKCGRTTAGDAILLAAEAEIVPRVMTELRPPRGAAAAGRKPSSPEELAALGASARERLGEEHWATAAALLVLHYRGRTGGAVDRFSAAAGCRFLGWLVGRGLPWPPASVVRTPVSVAIDCATYLAFPPAAPKQEAIVPAASPPPDGRCIAARVLTDFLTPIFNASGFTIAGVANTGLRVDKLMQWHAHLRSSCGRCGKPDVTTFACGKCKQVRYCSQECQKADWKDRHKAGCLAHSESLASESAWKLLASTS